MVKSGHIKKREEARKQEGCCTNRGGRLHYFMIWELIITIVSVGMFISLLVPLKQDEETDLVATVNLLKVVYGLLSFPFMIFVIPIVTTIMTKTKATKYDRYGRCIPDLPTVYEKEMKLKKLMKKKEKRDKEMQELKAKDYEEF